MQKLKVSEENKIFNLKVRNVGQMNPKKIFISSTYYDFNDLRAELKTTLKDWGYEPLLSEYSEGFSVKIGVDLYTACVEAVKTSDMLILIVGKRYGWKVPSNKDMYLFSWDEVPKNDSGRLVDYLVQDLKIDWAKDANINKIDNGKTITVTKDKNSVELKLNDEEDKVILKTSTGETYEYLAKKENGKLNTYKDISITELEYNTAMKNNIPRINFCLKEVWNQISNWKKNPKKKFPKDFEDGHKVMEFLERIRKGKTDNWIHQFETSIDIKNILKTQLGVRDSKFGIPKIENVLEKGKSEEAEFFRSWGPEWIDFEKGFVVKRHEVDEILKKFGNNNLIVIKGNPASGKSVILRNVGYELTNKGEDVYVIELKPKHTIPEIKEVLKLNQCYLFIDNAHLNFEFVDEIRQRLSNHVKVLVATRDIKEDSVQISDLKFSEYLKEAILIKSIDAREDIIKNFLRIEKLGKVMPEEIKEKLSKESLWVLAWQLRAYKKTKDVGKDAVCNEVENYFKKLSSDYEIENAEDIFLILSVFYKYEIPVRRQFVEQLVCGSKKDIEKLIEIREINETEEKLRKYLGLHHSEIAKVYLDLLQNPEFEGVGEEMKKKIDENQGENLFEKLFNYYIGIEKYRKECVNILVEILKYGDNKTFEGLILKFQENVRRGIEEEEDIEKIGWCIGSIAFMSNERFIRNPIIVVTSKIEGDEKNNWCIRKFSPEAKSAGENVIKNLDLDKIKEKIDNEEDVGKIGWCIGGTMLESISVAKELIEKINLSKIKESIEKEDDIGKIGLCVGSIGLVNSENIEILDLDIQKIKKKIYKEESLENIILGIGGISWGNENFGKKLIKDLDLKKIIGKIENEQDVKKIGMCVGGIAQIDKQIGKKLSEGLSLNRINEKISNEKDLGKISWCIGGIGIGSTKVIKTLVNNLNLKSLKDKIELEGNIKKVGLCLGAIAMGSKDVAENIIKGEPLKKTIENIEKEEDIENIGWCIGGIALIDKGIIDFVIPIYKSINSSKTSNNISMRKEIIDKLIKKMISVLLNIKSKIGEDICKSIDLTNIKKKILAEKDVKKIGWCIGGIALGDRKKAEKLVGDSDFTKNILEKIHLEDDVGKIGWCIVGIAFASEKVAQQRIVKKLDTKKMNKKINECEDVGAVMWLTRVMRMMSKEDTLRIMNSLDTEKANPEIKECLINLKSALKKSILPF